MTFHSFLVQKNTSTVASSSSINKQSVASNSTQPSEGTAGKLQSKKSKKNYHII